MKRFLVLFLPLIISLNSCSSFIKVKLLKPAEINTGAIKKIALTNFKVKGEWYFNDVNSIKPIEDKILGKNITNIFTRKLSDNGYFKIISENSLQDVNIDRLKNISREDLLKLKESSGIEAIIGGSVNYVIKDSGEWQDDNIQKNGIIVKNRKYILKRLINSIINYQVISTDSGIIIASKNNSTNTTEVFSGKDENESKEKLKNWKDVIGSQLDYLTSVSVNQLAPHYVTEDREIRDGKSNAMKNAYEYARREFWDDAKKIWEDIVRDETSLSSDMKEDAISAIYNLGVYYEVKGEFDKAEEMYQRAYEKTFKTEYLDYRARVEKRKSEVKKLKQQNIDIKN